MLLCQVSEIKLIRELLKDFEIEIKKPICIHEDYAGVISISKYGNLTKNSKYIVLRVEAFHTRVRSYM